jgi:hypothetical protein
MRHGLLFAVALVALALASPGSSRAQHDTAARAQALIAGLDYDEARRELASDADDPALAVERARLAIYELDCDGANVILSRPDLQKSDAGELLTDIARGCQRVTASLVVDKDEARGVEIRWQDEHDRPLGPLLIDTVVRARDALTRDLGVDWPRPTRVVVVRDLLSLSAMTGLPYKSAQTTGTVAVAKWGRITLLSPRASPHGYIWRDTIAHELTHLAVTRASRDQAPLWLQEGVAKREESRWRDPGPFDDRPTPDAVVAKGFELGLGLPLDRLGPSIAMLPSADAAMVAFAEVTSFVRFYAQNAGEGALPKLLHELRSGKDPDEALIAASGSDRKAWDTRWRSYVTSRPREPLPALFGLDGDRHSASRMRDLRDRTRLAELLLARDPRANAGAALMELDRIELAGAPASGEGWDRVIGDPSVRWVRARALEEAGRREEAAPLVADPHQVLTSFGPWWAVRGRWARLSGDEGTAASSFVEAVGADPLDVEVACESADPAISPADPAKLRLCDAARARGEPRFGGD